MTFGASCIRQEALRKPSKCATMFILEAFLEVDHLERLVNVGIGAPMQKDHHLFELQVPLRDVNCSDGRTSIREVLCSFGNQCLEVTCTDYEQ